MLARGGLRDSSIQRYLGAARAWVRYCLDRGEAPHDASTRTLLAWLEWRVRNSISRRSTLKLSLAAARFVQRGHCAVHGIDSVIPYSTRARIQLEAFARTCTMNRQPQARARPVRLSELEAIMRHVRGMHGVYGPRRGLPWSEALTLSDRDASMMLLAWWGALRADDLARLEWQHVHFVPEGIELHMVASKTTAATLALAERPDGEHLCPVRALRHYMGALPLPIKADAPVYGFASADNVGRRIRQVFKGAGLPKGYTAHSFRTGFPTECASQGIPDALVQTHGRWLSAQQHREYVRLGRLWQDTPTRLVTITKG